MFAPERPHLASRQPGDVAALVDDAAGGRLEQLEEAADERRLPAAGLADDAERLALAQREGDAVDRLHGRDLLLEDDPAGDREVLRQVLDDEELVPVAHALGSRVEGGDERRGLARLRLLVEVTGLLVRRVVRGDGEHRLALAADGHRVRAARVEPAARRRVEQRRRLARDLVEALDVHVEPRQRSHQPPGVRVTRLVEDRAHGTALGDPRRVHDDHVVRGLGDDAEVVRDHDHGRAEVLLHALDERQDLRLGRDVQRGGRLVGDDQVGVVDERHRDHHALAHAPGELVRVVVDPALGARDADRLQELERARVRLLGADVLVQA